jgi:hypothetical protein
MMSTNRSARLRALFAALAVTSFVSGAHAALFTYTTFLSGLAESPPNASPGTGFAQVDYDSTAHLMHVHFTFSGLLGTTTASHIHSATTVPGVGTAGVATTTPTFAGFPLGVSSGVYDNTLDLTQASSWNPSYVSAHGGTTAGAENDFIAAMNLGENYLNIHTTVVPGGEIRGFLLVPAPGAALVLGLGGLIAGRRRR